MRPHDRHDPLSVISLWLSLNVWLLLAAGPVSAEESPPPSDHLVREYLDTPDAERADQLLSTILADDRYSAAVVRDLMLRPRDYGPAATGVQPNVPLSVRGRPYSVALSVPEHYQPGRDYGLVICLHGAGFTGEAYLGRWTPRLGDDYILACPTYGMGAWWNRSAEELVLATMRMVWSRYRIDRDRVFLTGMSNGGIGAWIIGMHHADLFAGLAPMASGIDDVLYPFLSNLRTTPVYMIHGSQDEVMPVRLSRELAAELTRLGYEFVYREHERTHPMAGGHFFPREELPALVEWMNKQRRTVLPPHLSMTRDASHLEAFAWTRIDATDRIAVFSENLFDGTDRFITDRIYAKLDVQIVEGNRIEVRTEHVLRYSLFLNEELIDLSRPVVVITNGTKSFQGLLAPSVETMLRQARLRGDPARVFPIQVTITTPDGAAPSKSSNQSEPAKPSSPAPRSQSSDAP
jgi:pimeloyl-ACP methyl ester carboxylesterase